MNDTAKTSSSGTSGARGKWFRNELYRVVLKIRFWILVLAHTLVFTATFWFSYWLRFDFAWPETAATLFWKSAAVVVTTKLTCFYLLRSFHGWWRYVTFSDLTALGKSTLVSALALMVIDYFFGTAIMIPRSVLIVDSAITILILGFIRSSWRLLDEGLIPAFTSGDKVRTILIGTSDEAVYMANQIRSNPHLDYQVIGLVRLDEKETRSWIANLPVLGSIDDLVDLIKGQRIEEVLLTSGEVSGPQLRNIVSVAKQAKRHVHILPQASELFGRVGRLPLREVDINDLLRRDPVVLDDQAIGDVINGRRVLVTGAGGSIGSEICRQVLKFNPSELYILGRGENRIFHLEREIQKLLPTTKITPVIADVTNEERMRQVFEDCRPEIVFHAAAHKHVPLMEQNIGEAIRNNAFGTKVVADLADEFCSKWFVQISTDKAVNPTSVMGATKQLAERYINELATNSLTKFVIVRFGNVLGSAGSVVPIFREQIERGGPITLTDPRMRRYFMTIPEASRLVLQAAAMGNGGEIFVLDMGEPVEILSLAKDMIRLSGLPESAIDIVFTGTRPGEKLYEELYFSEEESVATSHPKLRAAKHRTTLERSAKEAIAILCREYRSPELQRSLLHEFIPEYTSTKQSESDQKGLLESPTARS